MPKVIEHTPPWLARPSPASTVFAPETDTNGHINGAQSNGSPEMDSYMGPKKLVAHRGTEIFVAVGKHIRWSDLCMLKEDFEAEQETRRKVRRSKADGASPPKQDDDSSERAYKVSSQRSILLDHSNGHSPSSLEWLYRSGRFNYLQKEAIWLFQHLIRSMLPFCQIHQNSVRLKYH